MKKTQSVLETLKYVDENMNSLEIERLIEELEIIKEGKEDEEELKDDYLEEDKEITLNQLNFR